MSSSVRVRFAPSPTGTMHIGNLRTALLNYLFAKQKNGTFILRIEDTDPARNFDVGAQQIIADLKWIQLSYQEGPNIGGPYAPYFQSERLSIYQAELEALKKKQLVYPCFCTNQELEKKRVRQQALKMPPRYDRECLRLSADELQAKFDNKVPFIWRFKLDHDQTIQITDLGHGIVKFEMKNFSDFPLTRADGTFTFMFSNFVDDMTMKITHVFRGEDHLSNTAGQAAMYLAFGLTLPIFYHMPILCNIDGKKLSKRDFGFSLHDLKKTGFLPEAINNYLAILGTSYKQEIMNLEELTAAIDFDNQSSASKMKYDVEKLRWVNHQWINKLSPQDLAERTKPYLVEAYPNAEKISDTKLAAILSILKMDFYVLSDAVKALKFYFEKPAITHAALEACAAEHTQALKDMIKNRLNEIIDVDTFLNNLKADIKPNGIPVKQLFWLLRLALMGEINGPSINDLVAILGTDESKTRIEAILNLN